MNNLIFAPNKYYFQELINPFISRKINYQALIRNPKIHFHLFQIASKLINFNFFEYFSDEILKVIKDLKSHFYLQHILNSIFLNLNYGKKYILDFFIMLSHYLKFKLKLIFGL